MFAHVTALYSEFKLSQIPTLSASKGVGKSVAAFTIVHILAAVSSPVFVPVTIGTKGLINSHCVLAKLYINITSPFKSPTAKATPPCFTIVKAPNPFGLKVGVVVKFVPKVLKNNIFLSTNVGAGE